MVAHPHLHVHSYYTFLGATPAPEELAQRAAAERLTHLALTDTNALYGAVAFDRACRAAGVQPIHGIAATVAWPQDLGPVPPTIDHSKGGAGLLILLARNRDGYRSLCRLSTLIQGHTDRVMRHTQGLSLEDLRANATGLLCLTGGRQGFAYRCLRSAYDNRLPARTNRDQCAHRFLGRLSAIFQPRFTFVSLELSADPTDDISREQEIDQQTTDRVVEKAAFLGLQTIAVQPIYTLMPDDGWKLRLLAAINRNCQLDEVPDEALPNAGDPRIGMHWLTPEQMERRFARFPEALVATTTVASLCRPALPDGTLCWPVLALPEAQTPEAALRTQATDGSRERYGNPLPINVRQRLHHELEVIEKHGYAPLFLVVADIVRYARSREIPVSTRGSVANALVAYVLGITTVDPIFYDLLFERFLSPGRADPPDIDLDFCSRRRDEILAYVRRKYGRDRVALIGAVSTLRWRSAARETAKTYGLTEAELRQMLDVMSEQVQGPSYSDARGQEESNARTPNPRIRQSIEAARAVIGLPHHLSIHAGGLVITPGPLTDLVPVQMAQKGYLITQFDHSDCEAIGIPKLDLLGIRALTVLADAAEQVRQDLLNASQPTSMAFAERPSFRLEAIPLDDPTTAKLLMRGATTGVFQCDSIGARRTLRKLKVRTVQDLAIANAFFKPGPAMGGQAEIFVRRYRGETPTAYQHPALEPILAPTKGVLIFQEQVLRVATEIAGLSWTQADQIRRGISRMNAEMIDDLQSAFILGCQRPDGPGFSPEQAQQLWGQISAFSGYGFNQGHATAYADVSYRSAYMKAHYPAAFFWARIRNRGGYHHPAIYMAEAIQLGIEVRPPHVNHSWAEVTLAWEKRQGSEEAAATVQAVLWLGLALVRDLSRRTIADLIRARKDTPFADTRDLLIRVPLPLRDITNLIRAGALDGLGVNRSAMLAEAETFTRAGTARQMAFHFATICTAPPSPKQHLAWEHHLTGYPLGTLRAWLPVLQEKLRNTNGVSVVAVQDLSATGGNTATLATRLPGRHRGGYAIWDGAHWTWAEPQYGIKSPAVWEPVVFRGHWRSDRWGVGWLAVQTWEPVALPHQPQNGA